MQTATMHGARFQLDDTS